MNERMGHRIQEVFHQHAWMTERMKKLRMRHIIKRFWGEKGLGEISPAVVLSQKWGKDGPALIHWAGWRKPGDGISLISIWPSQTLLVIGPVPHSWWFPRYTQVCSLPGSLCLEYTPVSCQNEEGWCYGLNCAHLQILNMSPPPPKSHISFMLKS